MSLPAMDIIDQLAKVFAEVRDRDRDSALWRCHTEWMTLNERNRIIGRRLVHDFHGEFQVVEGLGRTDVCPRKLASQW